MNCVVTVTGFVLVAKAVETATTLIVAAFLAFAASLRATPARVHGLSCGLLVCLPNTNFCESLRATPARVHGLSCGLLLCLPNINLCSNFRTCLCQLSCPCHSGPSRPCWLHR